MIRALCICLALVTVAGAQEYDRSQAMQISQDAIGRVVGQHSLRNVDGQSFSLEELEGRPLVISMIYTSCHHVCPLITANLADTVRIGRDALGEESFAVVTVGFDWREDTPERMRQYARQQGVDDAHWYFLASDAGSSVSLSEALGFQFFPSAKGFDHLSQTTIVDKNGVIYRQVYGVDIDTQSLVEPLKELVFDTPRSAGLLGHWLDTFKLFCTVYDPTSDRYRFDYSIFMTILVGILCLGGIAYFIAVEWKRAR